MKLHHALVSVVDLFQRAEKECWTYDVIKERLTVLDNEFKTGKKLQREQFAYNELKSALFHELAVFKTTLAYEYKGKLYAVVYFRGYFCGIHVTLGNIDGLFRGFNFCWCRRRWRW